MNKIIKAIQQNELSLFFLGKGEYHIEANRRNDLPDPNNFLWCWESEIIPFLNNERDKINFDNIFVDILKQEKDTALAINVVITNLFWYYYFKKKGDINIAIKFSATEKILKKMLLDNKEKLMQDKRWAGAEWNSSNGLWEPLQRVANSIKNEYNGINLII
jgi:hypothetical protein